MSYEACNAVLYDVLRWAQETGKEGSIAEVALTIVRIVEAIKKEGEVSWEEAEQIFHNNESNLETYLNSQD